MPLVHNRHEIIDMEYGRALLAWTGDGEGGVHLPQQQGRRPQGHGPDQGYLREVQAYPRPPPGRTGEINDKTTGLLWLS